MTKNVEVSHILHQISISKRKSYAIVISMEQKFRGRRNSYDKIKTNNIGDCGRNIVPDAWNIGRKSYNGNRT